MSCKYRFPVHSMCVRINWSRYLRSLDINPPIADDRQTCRPFPGRWHAADNSCAAISDQSSSMLDRCFGPQQNIVKYFKVENWNSENTRWIVHTILILGRYYYGFFDFGNAFFFNYINQSDCFNSPPNDVLVMHNVRLPDPHNLIGLSPVPVYQKSL